MKTNKKMAKEIKFKSFAESKKFIAKRSVASRKEWEKFKRDNKTKAVSKPEIKGWGEWMNGYKTKKTDWTEAGKKSWVTRLANQKKRSNAAKKAVKTKAKTKGRLSQIAKKAWKTRKARKMSYAGKKAWVTRRTKTNKLLEVLDMIKKFNAMTKKK